MTFRDSSSVSPGSDRTSLPLRMVSPVSVARSTPYPAPPVTITDAVTPAGDNTIATGSAVTRVRTVANPGALTSMSNGTSTVDSTNAPLASVVTTSTTCAALTTTTRAPGMAAPSIEVTVPFTVSNSASSSMPLLCAAAHQRTGAAAHRRTGAPAHGFYPFLFSNS